MASARRAALDAKAEAMYDRGASYREFAEEFTREELEILLKLCVITADTHGRSYDDEVCDAIALLDSSR